MPKKTELDKRDILILEELQSNARQSARKISQKTGLPTSTVFKRIKKLEERGIIKGYTTLVDPEKVGLHEIALVLIQTDVRKDKNKYDLGALTKAISNSPFVLESFALTGEYDMMLKICGKSVREIGKYVMSLITDFEHVGKTYSCMVLYCGKDTPVIPLRGEIFSEQKNSHKE